MRSLRLLFAILALSLLQPACKKSETPPTPTPDENIVATNSKRDVTICVNPGPMPDVMSTHVKANGKQRVCWKGHGKAYQVWFKEWPFVEPPDYTFSNLLYGLRAPADSAGDFFTLKDKLNGGATKAYPYSLIQATEPVENATPPGGGPEIVGEG